MPSNSLSTPTPPLTCPLTPTQRLRALAGAQKLPTRDATNTEATSMRRVVGVFPEFESPAHHRQHMKQRLAAAFRIWAELGFDSGAAGHATFRDPEFPDCFWTNPIGVHFADMTVGDLCMVNLAGEVVVGKRPVLSAVFAIHGGIYRTSPQVKALVHTHSEAGVAFSSLGKLLDPISQDACAFYGKQSLFDQYDGPVLDASEGEAYGECINAVPGCKLVVLRNHGLLAVGYESVDEMAYNFIFADKCCKMQMLASSAGTPIPLSHSVAASTGSLYNPKFTWIQFQPSYYRLLNRDDGFLSEEESKGVQVLEKVPARKAAKEGWSGVGMQGVGVQAKAKM